MSTSIIHLNKLASHLSEAGACDEAITWLGRNFELTAAPEKVVAAAPQHYLLWVAGCTRLTIRYRQMAFELITPEMIDECAAAEPWAALAFAPHRLTPQRLDLCAERFPSTALRSAKDLITPARAEACRAALRRGRTLPHAHAAE